MKPYTPYTAAGRHAARLNSVIFTRHHTTMEHPYRIIVTGAQGNRAVISLARVYKDTMPTRVRCAWVETVLHQTSVARPKGERVGVCMPKEPEGWPTTAYGRELQKMYDLWRQLVNAPAEVA